MLDGIVNIHNRLAIAFSSASKVKTLHDVFCFDAIAERSTTTKGNFHPAPLETIARFCALMR